MARRSRKAPKQVETLTHDKARRRNIPTAELQSFAEQVEEQAPRPPVAYPRSRPLPKNEVRDRDEDLDPQLIWDGARIRLTPDQVEQLQKTGEVELGDAQLVWRGKDRQDWSDLVVQAPPLYIQEKVHPKAIIDDLVRRSKESAEATSDAPNLFADFNGIDPEAKTEFYQHDQNWSNRLILGDSLHVMASLATREGLRGKVQCIYIDPPYGIKFNSNWQVSTQSRDVKDGKREDISREPEQVKAFRDTWKDGIHSYLTYLRDRLTVARELLTESGSIFVQIGDENVHRVRAVMDEVFGGEQHVSTISLLKTTSNTTQFLPGVFDSIIWYAKNIGYLKYRQLYRTKEFGGEGAAEYTQVELPSGEKRALTMAEKGGKQSLVEGAKVFRLDNLTSQSRSDSTYFPFSWEGKTLGPGSGGWKTNLVGMNRLARAGRLRTRQIGNTITYVRYILDFPAIPIANMWTDLSSGFNVYQPKIYVVQTNERIIERCILMATDPGDLVLDPTCGSGTSAEIAEQWGRRWITIDTSRVALALTRARIMGARYPYYYLADTPEGQIRESEVVGKPPSSMPTRGDIRQGFVYERAPHVTLKSIANNSQIDHIWEEFQTKLEPLRAKLNATLGKSWEEWQIPRYAGDPWPAEAAKALLIARDPHQTEKKRYLALNGINLNLGRLLTFDDLPAEPFDPWDNEKAIKIHGEWWELRIARQKEIDGSIARNAGVEFLFDRPYVDNNRVRVAGPFTVESLSPHRVVPADEEELSDTLKATGGKRRRMKLATPPTDFADMILENLRAAGVQQSDKQDAIKFTSLQGWPGEYIGAEGTFVEGETSQEATSAGGATGSAKERRAAIFLGPEFGTVSRLDLVAAAREASEARFDVLIACAFNYDAHASELARLGPLPILKAKMNPDLHMADDLKSTGKGNLFVVFGEPDIDIDDLGDGTIQVRVKGIDVFDPNTGEVRSGDTKSIAAWFIDTDYDEENFFVRHAYFLGANDPYKSLKTSLKAEIDEEAWSALYRDTSRPFPRPEGGRIAVKVINHFGDEVMKVFGI